MHFNKTIIFIPAHRYNMGRCTITETIRLNEHLNMLASMESPKHVISASSKYDLEYLRHYTGPEVLPLYSFSGYYTAKYRYNPTRNDIPVFARTVGTDNWDERFITAMKHIKVKKYATSSPTYTFDDLVKFRAIVYLPYAVMSYKITEFYSMGIPLFFPSMKYLHTYHLIAQLQVHFGVVKSYWTIKWYPIQAVFILIVQMPKIQKQNIIGYRWQISLNGHTSHTLMTSKI